jgi:hypothetical protein
MHACRSGASGSSSRWWLNCAVCVCQPRLCSVQFARMVLPRAFCWTLTIQPYPSPSPSVTPLLSHSPPFPGPCFLVSKRYPGMLSAQARTEHVGECCVAEKDLGYFAGWQPTPGQLVDASKNASVVRMSISLGQGSAFMCSVWTNGTVKCGVQNYGGQGMMALVKNVPAAATPHNPIMQNCTAYFPACVLYRDGTVVCWGANPQGQTTLSTLGPCSSLACDLYSTCAIRLDGRLICWGEVNNRDCHQQILQAGSYSQVMMQHRFVCTLGSYDALSQCFNSQMAINLPPAKVNEIKVPCMLPVGVDHPTPQIACI